jgi:hypothetical protein
LPNVEEKQQMERMESKEENRVEELAGWRAGSR